MLAQLQVGTGTSWIINREWLDVYARQVVLLKHPTLLRVFDVCIDDQDRWVLVLQALPGRWRWLYDHSSKDNRNEMERIGSILLSVSEALSYLHQVKFRGTNFSAWHESARVVEAADGELCFGMSPPTPVEAFQSSATEFMGAPAYTAPEALNFSQDFIYHPPTLASDSYSLGCLLFELLTGQKLITATNLPGAIRQVLSSEFSAPQDIRPELPAQLNDFVSRALSRSPDARPSLREWGFMMESLGGRLLRPPLSSDSSAHSHPDVASRAGAPNLVSVLEGQAAIQRITMLGSVGSGGMGGEYLAEISMDESALEQPPPEESVSAWSADDDAPTQPLTPPASINTGALPEGFISKTFSESAAVNSGALPADFVSNQNFDERTSVDTGALPDDFIPNENLSETVSVNTGALPADFAAEPETPLYLDENVQFTVFRPKAIVPQKWYSLLAFAHLSEKREDASEDEPDPVAEVRQQAQRILGEEAAGYQNLTQDTLQAVPRDGMITFVPTMPGIEFNPPSRSFTWEESVHREDFRLRAKPNGHDGRVLKGRLSVFLGSILLADIALSIRVDSHEVSKQQKRPLEEVHARPYRKIFASYSHRDIEVVEQFERFAEALGDRYLRDVTYLRSGERWSDKLEEMIVEADIFQLFWSSNSMTSPFVRQEWEYALSLQRPNFIRPTYWEEPLPVKPDQKLPPEELMRLHFQRIRSGVDSRRRAESTMQGAMPLAGAPEGADVRQSAVRESQSSGRAQSIDREVRSSESTQSAALPTRERFSASRNSERKDSLLDTARPRFSASKEWDQTANLTRETTDASPPPPPRATSLDPDDLLGSFRPSPQRGVGASEGPASEESPLKGIRHSFGFPASGGGGIGSSGRRGVGGSGPSDSARTIPSYRPPPTASMPPPVQASGRSGAGGRRLDVGNAPAAREGGTAKSPLVPVLVLLALGLLAVVAVILYFALS